MKFRLINSLTESQTHDLHQLYQQEWWSKGRSLQEVTTVLAHSDLVFGLCDPTTERLLAFTRLLTDRVFKAILFDVIVHQDHRGEGLGTELMQQVLNHPVVQQVQHVELYCLPERFRLYRSLGFTEELGTLRLMRRSRSA
ncbi:GNAT family N-acetyltransferase [Pedosphaera parvula]|uniref:GCN5-related N-acetyltransferase n=1 Tax=Pedosphaera parvula (strain Ellin514) TaxID=320771 RepID=B9XHF4_PEDPL|nr:GNAT family N-acetyltransferase [Pedosphaera parvula]EEF60789.1 GCN5-related N-acetyltransferase [Pedosphaera parvula Ellin514]